MAGFDLVVTGVGKANAAAGLAATLNPTRHAAILNIGIGGTLPGSDAGLGMLVVATASVYADEGLETSEGFVDCAALGFPLGPFSGSAVPADPRLLELLRPQTDRAGRIATVSTCSGTEALAAQVVARTGAMAEAMEGAAVAHVAARLGVPCAEVRAISNTTGDRVRQRWEIGPALAAITRLIGRLAARR
jgi:futalosine hydrolase